MKPPAQDFLLFLMASGGGLMFRPLTGYDWRSDGDG